MLTKKIRRRKSVNELPPSATFERAAEWYRVCEEEIEAAGLFGPRGLTRQPLFAQWRKLWSAMCDLERRYRAAQLAKAAQ